MYDPEFMIATHKLASLGISHFHYYAARFEVPFRDIDCEGIAVVGGMMI